MALCACHHLYGIHGGYMRLRGRAPDGLAWEVRPGGRWAPFGRFAADAGEEGSTIVGSAA